MKLILVSSIFDNGTTPEQVTTLLTSHIRDYSFRYIFPDDEKYTAEFIRKFISGLSKKMNEDDHKTLIVLMNCDKMSDIVQNILLKTIEESPYHIAFGVKNENALLATIQSRCQTKYVQFDGVHGTKTEKIETFEPSYKMIPAYSKYERTQMRDLLARYMTSLSVTAYDEIICVQDAIKKIEANCKIESVLFELISKSNR